MSGGRIKNLVGHAAILQKHIAASLRQTLIQNGVRHIQQDIPSSKNKKPSPKHPQHPITQECNMQGPMGARPHKYV